MEAQEVLNIVLGKLAKLKELAPAGQPFFLHPVKDFDNKINASYVAMALKKLAQEHKIINLLKLSSFDIDYDAMRNLFPLNAETMESYEISTKDTFRNFIASRQENNGKKMKEGANLPRYLSPYMRTMMEAIEALKITDENQPPKKNIEDWLQKNYPDLSENERSSLASFVRLPEMKKGGWNNRTVKKQ